jgi:hypothetical protein
MAYGIWPQSAAATASCRTGDAGRQRALVTPVITELLAMAGIGLFVELRIGIGSGSRRTDKPAVPCTITMVAENPAPSGSPDRFHPWFRSGPEVSSALTAGVVERRRRVRGRLGSIHP